MTNARTITEIVDQVRVLSLCDQKKILTRVDDLIARSQVRHDIKQALEQKIARYIQVGLPLLLATDAESFKKDLMTLLSEITHPEFTPVFPVKATMRNALLRAITRDNASAISIPQDAHFRTDTPLYIMYPLALRKIFDIHRTKTSTIIRYMVSTDYENIEELSQRNFLSLQEMLSYTLSLGRIITPTIIKENGKLYLVTKNKEETLRIRAINDLSKAIHDGLYIMSKYVGRFA